MINLTRAIKLYLDTTTSELKAGVGYDPSFNHVNMVLWITLSRDNVNDTGMLINVSFISRIIRQKLYDTPLRPQSVIDIINWAWEIFSEYPGDCRVRRIRIDLDDSFSWAKQAGDDDMFEITVKYSLAAAHRLVKHQLDEQENYELFGKCSHKSGHGHNYLLEITMAGTPDKTTGQIADMKLVEKVINEQIIEPFDHKNLNVDTQEFVDLIPTVENMAQVFFERLNGRFSPAVLRRVRVWETPQTYADYTYHD